MNNYTYEQAIKDGEDILSATIAFLNKFNTARELRYVLDQPSIDAKDADGLITLWHELHYKRFNDELDRRSSGENSCKNVEGMQTQPIVKEE